jgi:hypothetical protein
MLDGASIVNDVESEGVVSEILCRWESDREQGEAMRKHFIEDGGGVLGNGDAGIAGIGEIGTESDRAGAGENGPAQSVSDGGRRIRESEPTHETLCRIGEKGGAADLVIRECHD